MATPLGPRRTTLGVPRDVEQQSKLDRSDGSVVPQPLGDPSRGYESGTPQYGRYGAPPGAPGGVTVEKPKDNSKKNVMMGAAGGLAVGAVGGALVANAFWYVLFPVSCCVLNVRCSWRRC
jgi:hypothetical protein